jgi:predicted dehydrogenase
MSVRAPGVIVVGTGFGLRVHVPAFRAAGFDVLALVGNDADRTARRAERAGIPLAFTDIAEALDRCDAELVTIATPPHTHHELVMTVAAAGRALLCEKPLAVSAAEAAEMVATVQGAGVLAVVGNEFRWDPPVDALTRAIAAGAIGTVRDVLVARAYSMLAEPDAGAPPWWFDGGRGGGWLAANGSHLIDQIQTWAGRMDSVNAVFARATERGDGLADVGYQMQFATEAGATGVLHESAAAWGDPFEVTRVVGTVGTLWLDGGTCWLADRAGTRAVTPRLTADHGGPSADDKRPWTSAEISAYTSLARWLRDELEGETHPDGPEPASLADGADVMRVIDAARCSSRDRGWIPIDRS